MNEPVGIDERDVLVLHDRLLALHGGAEGVRDQGLLQSALGRPLNIFHHEDEAGVIRLATAYTAGIVRNYPFVDGNKRTGFVAGILFLELNGFRFTASEVEATRAVLEMAAGTMDEAAYEAFLRANSHSSAEK
ncbi:MAG: type II toxin-antitoxin system death-on-curing family toxin [Bryobacteraceae bacterium]|nr:type II toxin-antitoxin system death-on-curing family toxin [Bryobacteraceae bacterium]